MTGTTSKLLGGAVLVTLAGANLGFSYAPFGTRAALGVALGIAILQAVTIGSLFMEIGREKASFKLSFVAAAFLILALIGFMASDVWLRGTPPLPPPPTERAPGV